jgi:predicted nuclease of predicted toxin-antitoxin system
MYFLVDESTGTAVVEYLRNAGHDVLYVGEAMPQADDDQIIDRAARENRIIVTNDKHFGQLIFRSGKAHHGVLLFRLRDESAANRVRKAKLVVEAYPGRLEESFIVATEGMIRIRGIKKVQ